jgi:DNA-binding NarL/FixJ family response regulator
VKDELVEDYVGGPAGTGGGGPVRCLTNREREVLRLLASGKATKEVAMSLGVSVKTAETHRRSIMEKLRIYGIAELTKYALRHGLTTLDPGPDGGTVASERPKDRSRIS